MKKTILLALVILICYTLTACSPLDLFSLTLDHFDDGDGAFGLNLETNFEVALPEDGELLYEIFAIMGRDAKQYAVIQYEKNSLISDHFSWNPLDDKIWSESNRILEAINLWSERNERDPIPTHLLPSEEMLYAVVGDIYYPDAYIIFIFSPKDMRLFVLVNLR